MPIKSKWSLHPSFWARASQSGFCKAPVLCEGMFLHLLFSSRVLKWTAWTLLAVIAVATLSPIELRPTVHLSANRERFLAFAALGGAFWIAYPRHRGLVVLLLVSGAGTLEFLQQLIPDRHGVARDAAIKVLGAALGCLCGAGAELFLARSRPVEDRL